ncbi:sigma factor-like helix-turn-helix DNA-binding protein [Dactylosporangium sp. CA-152071]|uniref:sigma-70 region 4 domain-containing protein n=1 Tax=Dactylosporangium sp. CA-152071 TaxID=3239933 RepID=UPI003D90BAB9
MTITLDRPATTAPIEAPPARCPQGLPWCAGTPDNHDLEVLREDETIYHDSASIDLPMSAGDQRGSNGFTLNLERRDTLDGAAGRTRLYMATTRDRMPGGDGGYATLDEADQIAREILAHVIAARGMKRASDLRIGDRIAVDRTTHTVTGLRLNQGAGTVRVHTDLSGACVAAEFKPGEMVPLRGLRTRITTYLTPAAVTALARLSSRQRTAMQLRYVDGMSTTDTARVMGVKPDKVKTYIGRAKTQLRSWGLLDVAPAFGGAA